MLLKETFQQLLGRYTSTESITNELWLEIERQYSERHRHYHTLSHLENLLTQLSEVRSSIQNWDSVLFSLYYHDIIYNTSASDNEEKSAVLAEKRMTQCAVSAETRSQTISQILATKAHVQSEDNDCNYFTDADLSILGLNWDLYEAYFQNVRKEYSIYPQIIYAGGRKKVLQHFLQMDRIFKTDFFFEKYEGQAKINLKKELFLL